MPFSNITWYSSGESSARHSASVFLIFSTVIGLLLAGESFTVTLDARSRPSVTPTIRSTSMAGDLDNSQAFYEPDGERSSRPS